MKNTNDDKQERTIYEDAESRSFLLLNLQSQIVNKFFIT